MVHAPKYRWRSLFGFSVLEFAVTLPILLLVVVASFEVNSVLQARSAAQAAIEEGLRCLYPVDGVCSSTTVAESSEMQYEWYKTCGSVICNYSKYDFKGEGRYFKLPRYRYDFGAQVLEVGEFAFPYSSYVFQKSQPYWIATQRADLLVQRAFLPKISGTDPRNPSFVYKDGGQGYGTANEAIVINHRPHSYQLVIPANSNSSTTRVPVTLRIPSPPERSAGRPCFEAGAQSSSFRIGSASDMSRGCSSRPSDGTTRVAFHIKGHSSGTAESGCGNVEITLKGLGFGEAGRNLGGQYFTEGRSTLNFFPRGIPCEVERHNGIDRCKPGEYVGASLAGFREFHLYHSIEVSYDADYEISLQMDRQTWESGCGMGQVQWTFTGIDVFLPKVERSQSALACTNRVYGAALPPDFVCDHNQPLSDGVLDGNSAVIFQTHEAALVRDETSPSLPSEPSGVEILDELNFPKVYSAADLSSQFAALRDPATRAQYTESVTGQGTDLLVSECPEIGELKSYVNAAGVALQTARNYGVPESADTSGYIRSSPSAWLVCPPEISAARALYVEALGRGATLADARWRDRDAAEALPGSENYRWTKATCQADFPVYADLPAPMSYVPEGKLVWNRLSPRRATGEFEVLETGEGLCRDNEEDPADPDWLTANDSRYSCAEIEVGREQYQGGLAGISAISLFSDITPNLDAPSCDTCRMLRQDARSLEDAAKRLPPNRFFKNDTVQVNENPYPCPPGMTFPFQECVLYNTQSNQSEQEWELVDGGPYAGGVVPSECSGLAVGCSCRAQLVGYESGMGKQVFDAEAAEAKMNAMLEAVLPWAKPNCQGASCRAVEVKLPAGYDPERGFVGDAQSAMFEAQARIEVPLHVLPGVSVPVTLKARERWEGAFAR